MSNIGQNLQQITTDPANDAMPDFNPGGTQIVFTSDRTGNPDIWIITVATVDITRLTFDTANDFCGPAGRTQVSSHSYPTGAEGMKFGLFPQQAENHSRLQTE